MAKMKVHELAKELSVDSKDIISLLQDKGIEVKSHMSSIEDEAIDIAKAKYGKKSEAAPAEKKAEAK